MGQRWTVTVVGCVMAALWGCQNRAADPQPDFPEDAIIEPETVEVFFDEAPETTDAHPGELREQALVGEPARLVPPLRQGLELANRMIRPALVTLNHIAHGFEPVLRSDDRFLWEVADAGSLTTLVLSRDRDFQNQWNYTLSVRRADEAESLSLTLFEGFFRPGLRVADERRPGRTRQTGVGALRYQYDAISRFDQEDVRGTGSLAFRTGPERRQISILLLSFSPSPDVDPINARYDYNLFTGGEGSFRFRLVGDLFEDVPGRETLRQSVVWLPDHRGRGRAQILGDAFAGAIRLDECWDGQAAQVWSRWLPIPDQEVNDGDESQCPAEFVGIELPLPSAVPVNGDEEPVIPGD